MYASEVEGKVAQEAEEAELCCLFRHSNANEWQFIINGTVKVSTVKGVASTDGPTRESPF